jgi:hypothetical protein
MYEDPLDRAHVFLLATMPPLTRKKTIHNFHFVFTASHLPTALRLYILWIPGTSNKHSTTRYDYDLGRSGQERRRANLGLHHFRFIFTGSHLPTALRYIYYGYQVLVFHKNSLSGNDDQPRYISSFSTLQSATLGLMYWRFC